MTYVHRRPLALAAILCPALAFAFGCGRVPGQFERLLDDPATTQAIDAPGGITRDQHDGLRGLTPQLREWCAELDELGIPASVDHADVHPGNIFAAGGVPFDWGGP